MKSALLHISNLELSYQHKPVLKDLSWTIHRGESWLLSGDSGSGKTSLGKVIAGSIPAGGDIRFSYDLESALPAKTFFVESWYQFRDLEGRANFYYQQRYTSRQAAETLSVKAELRLFGLEHDLAASDADPILEALGFAHLSDSQLIELSSGERKKLQLIKALWLKPQLLIIDQPYNGLDASSRKALNKLLDGAAQDGVNLVLLSNDTELPEGIDRFARLSEGRIHLSDGADRPASSVPLQRKDIPEFLKSSPAYSSSEIVRMVDVCIRYGDKTILENINWEVKAGEHWLLAGHNGSGKSTLLSLINGDHPQSYANELYLFGNRRGSGESVWDIKQHIGLISPEFQWYFDPGASVWQSIASGFYDTVGLFNELPYSKKIQVDELIEYFGFGDIRNSLLGSLSLGTQRLVLLARTIIKNPELLILDEPCQGLDRQQTADFNRFIDELTGNGMTMIYVGHIESALPACIGKRITLENGRIKQLELRTLEYAE